MSQIDDSYARERVDDSPRKTVRKGPIPGTPVARNGGLATAAKYAGTDYYSQIGRKGGQAVKRAQGREFYAAIGKKGGNTTKARYGRAHYQAMGVLGGQNGKGRSKSQPTGEDRRRATWGTGHPIPRTMVTDWDES